MSLGYLSVPLGPFRIFSKIRGDIRESMFISGVNDTGDKRGKFWGVNFLYILLRAYLSALYCCRLNFCLFFIFRSRQAGIVSTVLSALLLTPAKNVSAVSFSPLKKFAEIITNGNNLCHGFSVIGGVVDTGDKFQAFCIFKSGINNTGEKCYRWCHCHQR